MFFCARGTERKMLLTQAAPAQRAGEELSLPDLLEKGIIAEKLHGINIRYPAWLGSYIQRVSGRCTAESGTEGADACAESRLVNVLTAMYEKRNRRYIRNESERYGSGADNTDAA